MSPSRRLYWIDSYGPAVYSADVKGGNRRHWPLPEPVGSLALRETGGAIVSLRSGFHALDFDTGKVTLIAETQPGELTPRLNDGKVDRQGPLHRRIDGLRGTQRCREVVPPRSRSHGA